MSLVTTDRDAGVVTLTLRREARANALTLEVLEDLNVALKALEAPKAVILKAAGRNFSTGGDVGRFAREVDAGNGARYATQTLGLLNEAILALSALPCPVIARVQGAVTGGALGLVLAADLVVMTPEAFIQPWYAVVGFAPDGGWTRMLADRIGTSRVRALHLLNGRLGADEAFRLGLIQAVSDSPDAEIADWLQTLARHDAGSLGATKSLLAEDLADSLEAERAAFVTRIDLPEVRDGMARFLRQLEGV
ncbi:enoyl-CoA hydratase/isomerase family protein [Pararhodobacter sp. CCB-MM2]|uniref:enoyl-CoA hydratase/isomerase family protein n=1 Tax=Pararhodobacter sp. CCB-MM2 TaxID=1786003 RepID=UPI000834A361|nr:enoyl-CoA hydratase/isomerase family protein [Pararhodobacter sp. CCB-MM2]